MSYTLKTFLDSNIAPAIQLLTKPLNFGNVTIQGISVQEIPLEDFVQEGELVLSTALGCDTEPSRILTLVQGVVSAKAAAIIFSFRDAKFSIPQDVLEYADDNSFAIFEIPWDYRFSAIQSAVLAAIQEDRLTLYKNLQNKLFNQFFSGKSLEDAALSISKTFRCPVRITDPFGNIFGLCGTFAEQTEDNFIQIKILLSGTLFGYLELLASEAIDIAQQSFFEQYLAFPLSMWFNKKNIEDLTAMRLKNDFVQNLANGNYDSFEVMVQQGLRLHFDLSKPYICIAMRIFLNGDISSIPEYSSKIANDATDIENMCLREARRRNLSIMISNLSLEFTIFLETPAKDPYNSVIDFIDSVTGQVQNTYPSFCCFWGISEISYEKPDFSRLYANASLTLQYCLNEKNESHCLTYRDTKKVQIISLLSKHPEIQQSAREILQPLLDYDTTSQIGLLETLTEYIHENYNISKTARRLHIHRQSLLYRLEKIESLTGMSLNSHDDLFVLEVFSRIFSAY